MDGQPLGFNEYLMGIPICKTNDLVLNRRAVPWPDALYLAAVERRLAKCAANDVMGLFIGLRDVATDLPRVIALLSEKGKTRYRVVSRLQLEG